MGNKVLKFKNYFLYPVFDPLAPNMPVLVYSFQDWLMRQKLHGPRSRYRTRFVKMIMDRVKEVDEERIKLLEDQSKNKKREVVYKDKDGKETTDKRKGTGYNVKDVAKFTKDWEDYLNEDYIIDVTPANRDIVNGVKAILLETNDEFEGRSAVRYDEWITAFEQIDEESKKKENGKS